MIAILVNNPPEVATVKVTWVDGDSFSVEVRNCITADDKGP